MPRIAGPSSPALPRVVTPSQTPVTREPEATARPGGWSPTSQTVARASAGTDVLSHRAQIDQAQTARAVSFLPDAVLASATVAQKTRMLDLLLGELKQPGGDPEEVNGLRAQLDSIFKTVSGPIEFEQLFHSVDNRALLEQHPRPKELRRQFEANLALTRPGDWSGYTSYLDAVTGSSPTTGNTLDFMVDGQVLEHVKKDLAAAKKSIDVTVFQWQADETGWALAKALAEKAKPTEPGQPKVKVRVLLDEHGTIDPDPENAKKLVDFMRKNDVEVIVNPAPLLKEHLDHRKVMVIDGATAYTGGMNIGDHYQKEWRDQQTRVEGPMVSQLAAEFRQRWTAEGGALRSEELSAAPAPSRRGPDEARVVAHHGNFEDTYIKAAYLKAFYTAEKSITVANPYFADPDIVKGLCDAAKRGVQVKLVLPAENDMGLLRDAARAFYPDLLAAGVEVYEYQGRMAHQKVATIDGAWSTFGSSNLDARSLKYNDELNVFSMDPKVARQIDETMFAPDLAQSRRITTADPSLRERFFRTFARYL